jgi:hypothetical protein
MTRPAKHESARNALRETARERRIAGVRRREALFDMAASGFSIETIAAQFSLTAKTVRRDMARVVEARRPDAAGHFIHLQIARLHKALRATEAALDRGDLRSVGPLVRIVAQLDRYHRAELAAPSPRARLAPRRRAPLALTRAPAPIAENLIAAESESLFQQLKD